MTTAEFNNLTQLERSYLFKIFVFYSESDNICWDTELTPTEKGVFGSLVKKALIYDSFEGMGNAMDSPGYDKKKWKNVPNYSTE